MAVQRRFRVHGVGLVTDFPFETPLMPHEGAADLRFSCVPSLSLETRLQPVYRSPVTTARGEPALELDFTGQDYLLRVAGIGEFLVGRKNITAVASTDEGRLVEIAFLGSALSLWLELRGVPVVHASAVEIDGKAVAFLSGGGEGKSSLAASFLLEGHRLLSDDIVAVRLRKAGVWIEPGYPQMRMWPTESAHFVPPGVLTPRLHEGVDKRCIPVGEGGFGRFCKSARPLAMMVLPQRQHPAEVETRLTPLKPSRAIVELTRYSFLGRTVVAAGLQPGRFGQFAEVARKIPFLRLHYPSGLEFLPRVRRCLMEAAQPSSP